MITPAIAQARAAGIDFKVLAFEGSPGSGYGVQAASALGLPPERVFKTLVARLDGARSVVAVLPVASRLDLKRLAEAAGAKRAALATSREAERCTGYVVGGISPLGLRQTLAVFLDASAFDFATICVSAGRRGLELELGPAALQEVCRAEVVRVARANSK